MVKKFLKFINKEINGLHEAAYLLALFAFLSHILALIRDRLLAGNFGAGEVLDVYYASFRIPDTIFVSIASIVSVSVIVPFLIERFEKGKEETKKFIDNIFSFFFSFIIVISLVVFWVIPDLVPVIFSGMRLELMEQVVSVSRIMLLSPILLGISNFLAGVTQAKKRFLVYAVSPILYNVGIIFGAVYFYPILGVQGLAWGVILGAVMHLLIQIPFSVKEGLFPSFHLVFDWQSIKKVVFISFPRTLALSFNQISFIVLTSFASFMAIGSISIFNFSYNLQTVPISIIGVSYSTALFPTLSRLFSSGEKSKFVDTISTAIRHIIFWSIPITVLFIVLRAQIVRVVLGSGSFDWNDTRLTAAALALFVVSALAQSLILLFVRGYYSGGKTAKPLAINFIFSILAIIFSYLLIKLFVIWPFFHDFMESLLKVSGINGTEVLMLPLGFALSQVLNAIAIWYVFEKDFSGFTKGIASHFFQSFSASVIIGFVAYLGLNIFAPIFGLTTLFGVFMQGFLSGILGIIAGIIVLVLLKNQEIVEIWKTLHQKIWKTRVIIPEQESL